MKSFVPKSIVTIIIPSWNTMQLLRECLRSLKSKIKYKQSLIPGKQISKIEIIVVDNGSADGSVEMVKNEFPAVNLIVNKTNLGFSRANNQAVKIAQGKLLFFLNSDTIVQDQAVDLLIKYMGENSKIGAVSPLLLNEDQSFQMDPCYLKFPSFFRTLIYYHKLTRKFVLKFLPNLLISLNNFKNPAEVDQLPGAALMVRKEIFQKVGGFDETFPIYFEDTDLCYRIKKLGYKIMVFPEAKIIHFGRKSIEPLIREEGKEKFLFLNFNSLFLFCEKNYSGLGAFLIKLAIFINLSIGLRFGLIKKLLRR